MPRIFYWSGVSQAKLSSFSAHQDKINRLLRGDTKSSDLDLKKHRDYPLYTIRLNRADRLLFTTIEKEGKPYILLLEVIANHDYQKSRFLKSGVLRDYLALNRDVVHTVLEREAYLSGDDRALSTLGDGLTESTSSLSDSRSEESALVPMMNYHQQWLALDEVQGAVMEQPYPLLVSGAPGSGKSCMALNLLMRAVSERRLGETLPLVCITASKHVARYLQAQWQLLPEALDMAGHVRDDIRFLTYDELLLEQLGSSCALVGEAHFLSWLPSYQRTLSSISKKKGGGQAAKCLSDADKVYQEFRVLSMCQSYSEYTGLGVAQSLFVGDERLVVWQAFERYRETLVSEGVVSSALHQLRFTGVLFSHAVVDEAQDLSICQLLTLQALAGGRVAYALDSNQNLMSRVSMRPLLEQYYHSHGVVLSHVALQGTYRCPSKVVSMANGALELKNHVLGGTSDKFELSVITQSSTHTGDVIWDTPPVDSVAFMQWLNDLREQHGFKETEVAIITPPAFIAQVKALTGSHLVFTPLEIKGLEYPCVVTYNVLSMDAFRQTKDLFPSNAATPLQVSPHRVKEKANDRMHHAPYFNQLFVSFSRATQVLVVLQRDEHRLRPLIHRLKRIAMPEAVVKLPEIATSRPQLPHARPTSLNDWLTEARRLYQHGNESQAKAIYEQHLDQRVPFVQYMEQRPTPVEKQVEAKKDTLRRPKSSKSSKASEALSVEITKKAPLGKQKPQPKRADLDMASERTDLDIASDKLLVVHLNLPGTWSDEPLNGRAILDELLRRREVQIRLLVRIALVPHREGLKKRFLTLVAPYFSEQVLQQGKKAKVTYLQYLIIVLSKYKGLSALWDDLCPSISALTLNAPIDDIDAIPAGSSLFYMLCRNSLDLVLQYWPFFLGLLTADGLNRPVQSGDDAGKSALYLLSSTPLSRSKICRYGDWIHTKITRDGLHQPVLSEGSEQGKTPFYYLCGSEEGLYFLTSCPSAMKYKLTQEGLFQTVTAPGSEQGKSPFYLLCQNSGGLAVLDSYWKYFKKHLCAEGIHRPVTGTGEDEGKTPFYHLCFSLDGVGILLSHWQVIKRYLTREGLSQAVIADGSEKGMTPLYALLLREEGETLLQEQWSDFAPTLTANALHKPVLASGPEQGMTLFYLLCDLPMFLLEHWEDIRPHLSAEGLHQVVTGDGSEKGMTPLYLLTREESGCYLIKQHWSDFKNKMTISALNQMVTGEGGEQGQTPLYHLCSTSLGADLMKTFWDDFKEYLIPKGLHVPYIKDNSSQEHSPFYYFCLTMPGQVLIKQRWDDFAPGLTTRVLEETHINNQMTNTLYTYLCEPLPGMGNAPNMRAFFKRQLEGMGFKMEAGQLVRETTAATATVSTSGLWGGRGYDAPDTQSSNLGHGILLAEENGTGTDGLKKG